MRNNYILVAMDTERISGARAQSSEIADFRLDKGQWPLYSGSRNRKMMTEGDRLLVYCGGSRVGARTLIGSAVINGMREVRRPNSEAETQRFLTNSPSLMIEMREIIRFKHPVSIRPILEQLDFCPKNLAKWGVVFLGGVRRISDSDFDLICRYGESGVTG